MGLFDKAKKAINDSVKHIEGEVKHLVPKEAIDHVISEPIKAAKITMDQLDDLQKEILKSAQQEAEKILNEAKHDAISNAFDIIVNWFFNGTWFEKIVGMILKDNKERILEAAFKM